MSGVRINSENNHGELRARFEDPISTWQRGEWNKNYTQVAYVEAKGTGGAAAWVYVNGATRKQGLQYARVLLDLCMAARNP